LKVVSYIEVSVNADNGTRYSITVNYYYPTFGETTSPVSVWSVKREGVIFSVLVPDLTGIFEW